MNPPVVITEDNGKTYFALERLAAGAPVEAFECRIVEYTDYLREDALRSQLNFPRLKRNCISSIIRSKPFPP
ncbi:hypothetical protein FACS189491_03360 [Spirochaetia bacterium]|nr:hypothetical protein FACS189491_03360 [Spirochaetia bacterium]